MMSTLNNIAIRNIVINRGTGAGGANTTSTGASFEDKTHNQPRLLLHGYVENRLSSAKHGFTLTKKHEDKRISFVSQYGLKPCMKRKYKLDMVRNPDEAYLIEYDNGRKVLKILEKKAQHRAGSVETKLWASVALKREYELVLGAGFELQYGLCVNAYFQKKLQSTIKKYTILFDILRENNIAVLFGDEANYFETLDQWIERE